MYVKLPGSLVSDADDRAPAAVAALPAAPTPGLILLVEDDPMVRGVTARLRRQDGHDVLEADRAEAALEIAERESFDVVPTGVVMPGLTGSELVRELSARGIKTPSICMSGHAARRGRLGQDLVGDAPVLRKPLTAEALRARVERALAGRQGRSRPGSSGSPRPLNADQAGCRGGR